jgi:hypothetical protein
MLHVGATGTKIEGTLITVMHTRCDNLIPRIAL